MQKFFYASIVNLLLTVACLASQFETDCAKISQRQGNDTRRLHELFKLTWDHDMREAPEDATFNGYPGGETRWSDLSREAIDRRKRELDAPLKTLRSIQRARLNPGDQLSYDLFRRDLELKIEERRFPDEYLIVSQLGGPQQWVPQVLALMPSESSRDLAALLARLEGIPKLIDQTIALMKDGLKAGVTPPKITMHEVPEQVKTLFSDDVSKNPLLAPFRATSDTAAREKATHLVKEKVAPAYERFYAFLKDTYIPNCRETIAWTALPDGAAWYAQRVREQTTTNLTPEQIHEIGLGEVKRLRKAMSDLIASLNFKGDFEDFKKFLRSDSRFFYEDPQELLRGYRDIAKRIDPGLPRLFGKLPRLTYGVLPVPSYAEKSQPTAYYEPGAPQAGRAGNFFANTYDLKMRPKWEMEALTLHEAVPGHHLQIALAQELEQMPEFRKHAMDTAFVEGWGLYAESLGADLGLYTDAYSKFGGLTYEMWRAVRLVVDTGMHVKGWTRQQAIDFFKENTSKTEHDINVEVDRYIVWAGQALAYKIGQLKIKELRELARGELGERFDIRAFHDQVLSRGALPLDVLERFVRQWIAKTKKR